jgi:hypothetical protein
MNIRIESDCIGPHHAYGPNFHISFGAAAFVLRDRGNEWLLEWHRWCGPSLINRRTGDPCKHQPPQKSRYWLVAQWWHDQGGKVVDGVGLWSEPEIIETRWTRINGRNPISDPDGDIVIRHYKGYEHWGPVKP